MVQANTLTVGSQAEYPPLPAGYYALHGDTSINFQMNRFYHWVGDPTMLAELRRAAPRMKTYADLKREVLALAERALADGHVIKAAYYFRLAEFFIFVDDPDKQPVRKRFLELIKQAHPIFNSCHVWVPYEAARLSAYRFTPADPKSTIVLFGGFDSYIEEWFPMFSILQEAGYDVVAFEGPGQGTVLEEVNLPMTQQWEQPVKAILDYFHLDNVTLVGLSLGGGLAIRAAAGEPRIRRVVADDILTDFYEVSLRQASPVFRTGLRLLLHIGASNVVNRLVAGAMRQSRVVEWGVKEGMHVMGVHTPYDFFKSIMRFQTRDVSPRVTQDVLLLAGAADHYVPVSQFYDQIRWLTQAHSVTARLFTSYESAQNHVQVGNIRLSLDVIMDWVQLCSQPKLETAPPPASPSTPNEEN